MSKYRVISGPYFPVFGLNTEKYGPEKTSYLDTFRAVKRDKRDNLLKRKRDNLLKRDKPVTIHHMNIHLLAIELFKAKSFQFNVM